MLDLGKIKINSGALLFPAASVVKEIQREIEETRRSRLAIHFNMFFRQMPTTRSHQESCDVFIELIILSLRTRKFNRSANGVADIDLAIESCLPGWRMSVLK